MVSKNRRERERHDLRENILNAAREIARAEGWQAVTLRKVADKIEYTHPAIYAYFESKEAIQLELLRTGYRLLFGAMQAASETTEDPALQLLSMSDAYWDFALTSSELYQVMHGLGGIPFGQSETPIEAKQTFAVLRDTIQRWGETIGGTMPESNDAADALWGMVHGLVTLAMAGRIAGGPSRAKAIMHHSLQALLFAWGPNGMS